MTKINNLRNAIKVDITPNFLINYINIIPQIQVKFKSNNRKISTIYTIINIKSR